MITALVCPECHSQLQHREESKDWYCLPCDQIYAPSPDSGSPQPIQPTLTAWDREYDELKQRGLIAAFGALYYWGYRNPKNAFSNIFLISDTIRIVIQNETAIEVPYDRIEILNIRPEKEITALRTFLIGPTLAAAFKKETRHLTIGFRDELGLLQVLSFKVSRDPNHNLVELSDDVLDKLPPTAPDLCYELIMQKIEETRKKSST